MGIQVFQGVTRQRARLLGEIQRLEGRIQADQARLEELRHKVAAFDEVLREQNIDIDADQYAPVKPTKRLAYFAHGEIKADLLLWRQGCLDFHRGGKRH